MFLHLGGDIVVKTKTIIAIMDLETSSVSKITKEFLKIATKEDNVININTYELPKSYVICEENGEKKVYVSDGFVISKNLSVNMIVTVDQEFRYSAHNPVLLEVTLK